MAPHHSFPFIQEMPPAAASPAPPRPPGSPRVEHHRAPGRSICGAARYSEKTCRAMERHGGRPPAAPLSRATRRTRRQWCLVPAQAAAAADASPACSQFLFQSGVLFVASLAGSPLPLHTSTRGWTVPQLPSGVDGISFTVHPLGSRSRAPSVSASNGQDTPDSDFRVSSPSPRPLVEAVIPRRCLASPVSGELRPLLARARVQSNHPSSDWMHCVLAPERWILDCCPCSFLCPWLMIWLDAGALRRRPGAIDEVRGRRVRRGEEEYDRPDMRAETRAAMTRLTSRRPTAGIRLFLYPPRRRRIQ